MREIPDKEDSMKLYKREKENNTEVLNGSGDRR